MKEVWKDIVGYEGLYQVSNLGRVKSLARKMKVTNPEREYIKEGRIVSFTYLRGYPVVNFHIDKKRKCFKIHRLVAIAFVPNPLGLSQVNHKDHNKTNNQETNLEWVSNRENCTHKFFQKKVSCESPGVCIDTRQSRSKKFIAQLQIDGKQKYLGSFYTEEEASQAYQMALSKHGITNKYSKVA